MAGDLGHLVFLRFPSLRHEGIAVERFPRYLNQTLNLHSVPVVLMSYIVTGRAHHVMGDREYQETGGSLAITHYGQEHDILTDKRGIDVYNAYLDLRNHPRPDVPPRV